MPHTQGTILLTIIVKASHCMRGGRKGKEGKLGQANKGTMEVQKIKGKKVNIRKIKQKQ